jgi:preprotein translocase subunit SecE
MDRVKLYIQESYNELMHKVSWPTWQQLQESAVVVLIGTIIIALLVLAMDLVSQGVIQKILYEKVFKG